MNQVIQTVTCQVAVLAIAVIYYAWRDKIAIRKQPKPSLNERVAYMLWIAANRA
jgi:hypothetical protein